MNEEELLKIISGDEDYDLEFKKAKDTFNRIDLVDYCAAIANENGGYLLLGVNNSGQIVGSNAFSN